jgi:hypothetical protein
MSGEHVNPIRGEPVLVFCESVMLGTETVASDPVLPWDRMAGTAAANRRAMGLGRSERGGPAAEMRQGKSPGVLGCRMGTGVSDGTSSD